MAWYWLFLTVVGGLLVYACIAVLFAGLIDRLDFRYRTWQDDSSFNSAVGFFWPITLTFTLVIVLYTEFFSDEVSRGWSLKDPFVALRRWAKGNV